MNDDVLNEATQELNGVLNRAVLILESLGLGVRAQIPLPDFPEESLVFEKDKNVWGLFLVSVHNQKILVTHASRGKRIRAAH